MRYRNYEENSNFVLKLKVLTISRERKKEKYGRRGQAVPIIQEPTGNVKNLMPRSNKERAN